MIFNFRYLFSFGLNELKWLCRIPFHLIFRLCSLLFATAECNSSLNQISSLFNASQIWEYGRRIKLESIIKLLCITQDVDLDLAARYFSALIRWSYLATSHFLQNGSTCPSWKAPQFPRVKRLFATCFPASQMFSHSQKPLKFSRSCGRCAPHS